MIQRYTAHYDVLDKVVRYAESREGPLVLCTAHIAEVTRLLRALRWYLVGHENLAQGCGQKTCSCTGCGQARALVAEYKEVV